MRNQNNTEGRERELEEEIGQLLRSLPNPKAPSSLLARVMREVEAVEALPWYRTSWFNWPVGWRAASVGLMGVLILGGVIGVPTLLDNAGFSGEWMEGRFLDVFGPALGFAALLRVGLVALEAMIGAVPPEAIGLAGASALLMIAMTIVVGAALRRLSPDWEMYS